MTIAGEIQAKKTIKDEPKKRLNKAKKEQKITTKIPLIAS